MELGPIGVEFEHDDRTQAGIVLRRVVYCGGPAAAGHDEQQEHRTPQEVRPHPRVQHRPFQCYVQAKNVSWIEEEVPYQRTRSCTRRRFRTSDRRVNAATNRLSKGETMPRQGLIWTIVGILLIIALVIYIF